MYEAASLKLNFLHNASDYMKDHTVNPVLQCVSGHPWDTH